MLFTALYCTKVIALWKHFLIHWSETAGCDRESRALLVGSRAVRVQRSEVGGAALLHVLSAPTRPPPRGRPPPPPPPPPPFEVVQMNGFSCWRYYANTTSRGEWSTPETHRDTLASAATQSSDGRTKPASDLHLRSRERGEGWLILPH